MRSIPATRPLGCARLAWTGSLLAALGASGCHVVDAKLWNLKELHDDQGRHKYSGAIENDIEYFLRHKVARSLTGTTFNLADKATAAIPDPSTECLDNLIGLEDFEPRDPRTAGLQVEWFARLAVEDPWKLSRERAVHGLGRAGARLGAGIPVALPKDQAPAGPEAVGEAMTQLVRAAGPVVEHGGRASETERIDLEAACKVIEDLALDIDGARRLLRVTAEFAGSVGATNTAAASLLRLSEELERRCVRQALAAALLDNDPVVRAAAVEASAACAGPVVLDPILTQLERETSPEVLMSVLAVVREGGLPEPAPGTPADARNAVRERQLAALYGLLDRSEGAVRVAAMRALARVSGAEVRSLREEDWQTWWQGRREKRPL